MACYSSVQWNSSISETFRNMTHLLRVWRIRFKFASELNFLAVSLISFGLTTTAIVRYVCSTNMLIPYFLWVKTTGNEEYQYRQICGQNQLRIHFLFLFFYFFTKRCCRVTSSNPSHPLKTTLHKLTRLVTKQERCTHIAGHVTSSVSASYLLLLPPHHSKSHWWGLRNELKDDDKETWITID
jgi:hypothetical protein